MHLGGAGRSPGHPCQTHLAACQASRDADPCRDQALPVEILALSTEYEEDRVDFAADGQEPPGATARLDRHEASSRAPPSTIGS